MFKWTMLVFFACLACGCTTTLTSERVHENPNGPDSKVNLSGLTYKLPAKRITLSVAFQITDCTAPGTIVANVTPTISQSLEGDDEAVFVLDYQRLKAATKTQKLSVTLGQGGMLVAVNSDNQDKTADVITNTVSGALTLTRATILPAPNTALKGFVITPRPAPHPKGAPPPSNLCEHYLTSRLAEWKALPAKISSERKKDDQRAKFTSELYELNLQLGTLKDDEVYYKQVGNALALKNSQEDERKVRSKIHQLNQASEEIGPSQLEDLQSKLAEVIAALTFTIQDSFLPRVDGDFVRVSLDGSDDVKWTLFGSKEVNCGVNCPVAVAKVSSSNSPLRGHLQDHVGGFGIAYRTPVVSKIVIEVSQNNKLYVSQSLYTPIPQLGFISSLDLRNAPFENNTIAINFDENGQVSKLDFSSAAQAAAAASAFNSSTQSYLDFVQKVEADRVNAIQQELNLTKTRADTAASIAADRNSITTGEASAAVTLSQDGVQTLQNAIDQRSLQAGQANGATRAIFDLQRDNQLLDLKIQNAQKLKQLRSLEATGSQ